jgi:hypothetical protein
MPHLVSGAGVILTSTQIFGHNNTPHIWPINKTHPNLFGVPCHLFWTNPISRTSTFNILSVIQKLCFLCLVCCILISTCTMVQKLNGRPSLLSGASSMHGEIHNHWLSKVWFDFHWGNMKITQGCVLLLAPSFGESMYVTNSFVKWYKNFTFFLHCVTWIFPKC